MKVVIVVVTIVVAVIVAAITIGYLISNIRSFSNGRYLKDWRLDPDEMAKDDEYIRACLRVFQMFDRALHKIDIPEPIGISGYVFGSKAIKDGEEIGSVKIYRIERIGLRGPINSFLILAGAIRRVNELYRVYTASGIYYIRPCDCSYNMGAILGDMDEGVRKLQELSVEPLRQKTRKSLLDY